MRMPQPGSSSYSAAGPPWWRTTFWSVTTWISAVHVIVFIIDVLTYGQLTHYGALSGYGIRHVQFWQLIPYQFLHAGPWHLIFNMLWLYFLGPLVEWRFGKRRFLLFYLICGLAGRGCFLLQSYLLDPLRSRESVLVRASAGIFGSMAGGLRL